MNPTSQNWADNRAAARATLRDGGGTFRAYDLSPVTGATGYAIGLGNGSKVVENATFEHIALVIERAVAAHKSAPYVGTWIDDGVIYIDPVVILQSREDALTLARALGEQAIYGFAEGTSIEC